ncbi:MAG: carbohydrate ABC transporter permease [Lachnospiraceae bacterium]|nr:carbohydrate ABC transporter permease [Lachnospiraceae bacterium]
MGMKRKAFIGRIVLLVFLTILAIIYIYPVFLMFMNSFKPFGEVVSSPIDLPKEPTFENITYVVKKIHYGNLFVNNVMITVIGIVGIVFFSSLAAYILDRRRNRYTGIVYTLIITPMLIPFQTIMITLLKAMNIIHLDQSRVGLGIQYWGFGIPMATFIFFNFMKTIPKEIDESAKIDGASTWKTYTAIIFPLMKPVTFTVIVLDVMWIWNDFLLPLLMVNSSNKTKTLVLAAYTFVGQMNTKWQYAMAAMALTVLPSIIIFILLQKYIVEGVVAGAVKG